MLLLDLLFYDGFSLKVQIPSFGILLGLAGVL